ncbi:MAG: hypothetical protein KDE50_28560, partial [Caldilineaceae bacterium]|nr:hypothetical protein [Caldilineaceae bacterium]
TAHGYSISSVGAQADPAVDANPPKRVVARRAGGHAWDQFRHCRSHAEHANVRALCRGGAPSRRLRPIARQDGRPYAPGE